MVRLHAESQLHRLPESASKVCVVGVVGWVVVLKVNLVINFGYILTVI